MVDFKKILNSPEFKKAVADGIIGRIGQAPLFSELLPRAEPSDGEDPMPGPWDPNDAPAGSLQQPSEGARWSELLAGAAEYHEVQDLLEEPDLWAVTGLAQRRVGPPAAGFSIVRVESPRALRVWLERFKPHLVAALDAALALRALETDR